MYNLRCILGGPNLRMLSRTLDLRMAFNPRGAHIYAIVNGGLEYPQTK